MTNRDTMNVVIRKEAGKLAQIYCVMNGITLVDYFSKLINEDLKNFKEELKDIKKLRRV